MVAIGPMRDDRRSESGPASHYSRHSRGPEQRRSRRQGRKKSAQALQSISIPKKHLLRGWQQFVRHWMVGRIVVHVVFMVKQMGLKVI